MDSISVNQFRNKLKDSVDNAISNHQPLKVTRRNGDDFVVISAEDWSREQETLYVLQNNSLLKQIVESQKTHNLQTGYTPTNQELDEIVGF